MARNQIQFQKGMSLTTFQRLYDTEQLCHAALELMRHLDVTWKCAWLIKQKLMEVMFQRRFELDKNIECLARAAIRS